jgi:hypothetical protein
VKKLLICILLSSPILTMAETKKEPYLSKENVANGKMIGGGALIFGGFSVVMLEKDKHVSKSYKSTFLASPKNGAGEFNQFVWDIETGRNWYNFDKKELKEIYEKIDLKKSYILKYSNRPSQVVSGKELSKYLEMTLGYGKNGITSLSSVSKTALLKNKFFILGGVAANFAGAASIAMGIQEKKNQSSERLNNTDRSISSDKDSSQEKSNKIYSQATRQ